MAEPRVAVAGLGVITPVGAGPEALWQALLAGRSAAAPVRSFDTSGLSHHVGCEVAALDLPDEVRANLLGGRCTELAACAALAAVRDAGWEGRLARASRAAVVVGTTMGEVTRFEQDRQVRVEHEPGPEDVWSLVDRPLDVIGRSLAAIWGLAGQIVTVPAACAAGAYAIGMAAALVRRGAAPLAIAVGAEAFSRLAFIGFARMHAMSPDHCRPFSLGRPGLLLGEGAGAVVLESAESLRARGGRAWGFVDGFGLSCDAHHVTGPHPAGDGAARASADAVSRAGLTPSAVDYVNAHGTGTPLNDRIECLALQRVFDGRRVPVSSIKALTGHLMGAAGSVEAIASLLAMRHGLIPPTWNWQAPDPDCDIDCVPNAPREARLRHVLSNSYAFGGNNASLLLTAAAAS